MNRSQLRALVLTLLDDPNGGYFTESIVNSWLNDATREVQKRLIKAGQNYYVKCVSTTTVISQRDYALPQDFLKIHRLDVITSGTTPNETAYMLTPIIMEQMDFMPNGTGSPRAYIFKRNKLTILPACDTAYTLRLWYSYLVPEMTLDSDTPDVPEQYHELIAYIAAETGFLKDGRASELLVKRLKEREMTMDSDAQERNIDFPRSVNMTDNSYDGGLFW